MPINLRPAITGVVAALLATAPAVAEPTLTVDVGRPAGDVGPLMYGLMTEEINHSYDGGLYAELVRNRAFMDSQQGPVDWSAVQANGAAATIALDPSQALNDDLTTSLRMDVATASAAAPAGLANGGYWGLPVTPNTRYRASFYAKASAGYGGTVTLAIQSPDGKTAYATAKVPGLSAEWKRYEAELTTTADVTPTTAARYALTVDRPGTVWLQLVSLFPPTWHDRPNGMRRDLMQMLVDLHPKFLRLPGGNYVEGGTIATRYPWKKTLGPLDHRPGHPSTWGYRSSDGLGLLEYLQWCQDMGAEPVLAVYSGYSLGGAHVDAGPKLQPFVDEALDEIEYVTGGPDTTWGARRARDGHPDPFPLHYVEVGNEDWFDKSLSYDGRYAQFHDAIKARYPQLKVVSTVGNEQPKYLVHSRTPDAVDEHYYRPADEFIRDSPGYYEKYDHGKRPEIFCGEWASYEDAKIKPWDPAAKKQPPTPNFKCALGDAAWMAAMERNADLVRMNCYAPMLVNVNPGAWQWRPDLIGYDAGRSFGSPSYQAIKMFSTAVGDQRLTVKPADTKVQASATRDTKTGTVYLKLVNPTATAEPVRIELAGMTSVAPTAAVVTLSADPMATNSIDQPTAVLPHAGTVSDVGPSFVYPAAPHSISVLTINASPQKKS